MKASQCKSCREDLILGKGPNKAFVMFVGLSSKPGTEALCSSTNSGKLICEIEQHVAQTFNVYKTNLVKCAPMDASGKLRYPTPDEMRACLPRLLKEIDYYQPRVIVPLGGQVAKFIFAELMSNPRFDGFGDDFRYQTFPFKGSVVLPVHHPSYVWIYRRKRIPQYIGAVSDRLLEVAG
jgi:DNA polymerase